MRLYSEFKGYRMRMSYDIKTKSFAALRLSATEFNDFMKRRRVFRAKKTNKKSAEPACIAETSGEL